MPPIIANVMTKIRGGAASRMERLEMDWFKFHTIWSAGLHELSDAEAGRFIKSLCEFAETGEIRAQAGNERFLLSVALKQMKSDTEHSARISGVRAEAGRAGGRAKSKQLLPNAGNCKQNKANALIKNKELRIKNKEEEFNINCAEAQLISADEPKSEEKAKPEKPPKPALTPDDDAWWDRFGAKKELAIAFYRETKLYPMNGDWGHWQKDLDRFLEAGISVDLMIRAIRKIQAEGKISYKTPGSVFSTARWLLSRQDLPGQGQTGANQANQRRLSAVEVLEMMERQGLPESSVVDL